MEGVIRLTIAVVTGYELDVDTSECSDANISSDKMILGRWL